ncbi:MAG: HAD-IG family 5'-nucleotidase [Planctomycetota bacterium]
MTTNSPLDLPLEPPAGRGVFCNRTLNLRAIRAIGYDMDYTLVHYNVHEWELCAYEFLRNKLAALGWPVTELRFTPERVIRGLMIDKKLGNIVKANRFGYVKRAYHGTKPLEHDAQRQAYGQVVVDLSESRWEFLNTLFSLSEGCMYAQLVDLHDQGALPRVAGYQSLYEHVRAALDEAHMEGVMKAQILSDPDRFVELDPQAAQALLDQRDAGKKLLLITNSEWSYTQQLMSYAYDRFVPAGQTWVDLFDIIVVSARKPTFFSQKQPIFEVVDPSGLLRPVSGKMAQDHRIYLGGHVELVEASLGLDGADILYVGDHIFSDVNVSKNTSRWRTALIIREIEAEIAAILAFAAQQRELEQLMAQKVALERRYSVERVLTQRRLAAQKRKSRGSDTSSHFESTELRQKILELDGRIAPLARAAATMSNAHWGLLMRTGNDKSHLARQIERHADIYTSRVSNFVFETPFAFLHSQRGSLPHDPGGGYGAPSGV